MDENMVPPNKRRKLLSSAHDVLQQSEVATRPSGPPFFHGVEHIESSPRRVDEVHLEIRNQPIKDANERLHLFRRQGTAAASDISTNSGADVVVEVTADVDVFGSTTALTSATVTADLPDVLSLLSTSVSTAIVSHTSSESTSSDAPDSSEDSSSSKPPSTTNTPSSINSEVDKSSSSSSSNTSSSPSSTQSENQSHDESSSTSAASGYATGTAPARSSRPSQGTIVDSSTSAANSSIPASTSHMSHTSASQHSRLNLTTSASTRTSGSSVFVSDYTIDLASVTSSSADSTSSIDLNALFLATLSDGDVETITRSDEAYSTTLSDGRSATISPSSSISSSGRKSSARVTTISDEQSTVRSTIFSTAEPSSTSNASDDSSGVGIAGAADQGATGTSSGIASTSTASSDDADNNDETAPAGTIAGGVVGGAAGLALVVLIILLFLRRYKKRAQIGHNALPANSAGVAPEPDAGPSSGGPGMAERAGLMPFAGAVPALFRHQSRSQHSGSGTEGSERGFQRVSGRKLPSAFSEGMSAPPQPVSSPPPTMPLVSGGDHMDRNLSSQSFYQDSTGFYGGDGSLTSPNPFSDANAPPGDDAAEKLTMSPGPQRRPTVHAARSNVQNPSVATSGTPSWTPSSAAAFGRSETPVSLDGSRNSRFTEEV